MKVLSVNAGSSSLKLKLYDMVKGKLLVSALFERIGLSEPLYSINGKKRKKKLFFKDHEEAVKIFLDELQAMKIIKTIDEIEGIGHRVVHGADKYFNSVIINEEVMKDIDLFSSLAPLHNPANLMGIKVFKKLLPNALSVAVFDTAFHQTMSQDAYLYPVPYEWYTKYGVRKYGFHGTSHKYIAKRISRILKQDNLKIVSCHLGNGSSITAIKDGKVIDTSIGFTPLSGVMMGTRCGDIDASIIPYIIEKTDKKLDEVMNDLNKNSGLLGISGISNDLREIENGIKKGDQRCLLARKLYVNRIVAFISYYYVLLSGIDVLVFTAGIGENSIETRKEILEHLKPLGVIIDKDKNKVMGKEILISDSSSTIKCYVIPTDEEALIAEEVFSFLKQKG